MAACCCAHPSLSWDLDIPAMFHDRNTELIPISCRASSLPLTPSHAPKLLQSYACFSSPTALLLSYPKFLSSAEVFKPQGWRRFWVIPSENYRIKHSNIFCRPKPILLQPDSGVHKRVPGTRVPQGVLWSHMQFYLLRPHSHKEVML